MSDPSEPTEPKQSGLIPFKPGQSGNPNGRPKGSRNRLGEVFIEALHADFQEHGVGVIAKVRDERPHEYLKVVASLLPKQVEIKDAPFDGVTDDQLAAIVIAATAALGVAGQGAAGTGDQDQPQQAKGLPAVH